MVQKVFRKTKTTGRLQDRIGKLPELATRSTRFFVALSYVLLSQLAILGVTTSTLPATASAQAASGECGVGSHPVSPSMPLVQNGNFAISPASVYPAGDPGTSRANSAFYYADAGFYSQMANRGLNEYPDQNYDERNAFGVFNRNYNDSPGLPELNQVTFPGDGTFGIGPSSTWFYSNGNIHNGADYLVWGQKVNGLTVHKNYVFVSYMSNVIEPVANEDDPLITLVQGGTPDKPNNGVQIKQNIRLTEAATSNTSALNGWQRVSFSFTATSTSEVLKIIDTSDSIFGDDFAMTSVMIQECAPNATYNCSASASNPSRPVYAGQPISITASFRQVGGVAPNVNDYRIRTSKVEYPSNSASSLVDAIPATHQQGSDYFLDYSTSIAAPNSNSVGRTTLTIGLYQNPASLSFMSSCTVDIDSFGRPFFQVEQNDVWAGAAFADSSGICSTTGDTNAEIRAFARKLASGAWQGANVDFAATALGGIVGTADQTAANNFGDALALISAAQSMNGAPVNTPNALNFRNTKNPPDAAYLGGDFDDNLAGGYAHCIPNYYEETRLPAAEILTVGNNLNPASLTNNSQHQATGNVTLQGGTYNKRATLYVDGDLYITGGSILVGNGAIDPLDPLSIPYLSLIVRGNIYIDRNVTEIHAFLAAQPTGVAGTGRVYTCSSGFSPVSLANVASQCGSQLTIHGAVSAQSIVFLRSGGDVGTNGVPTASEVIRSSGALYAGRPVFKSRISGSAYSGGYTSFTGLPPIY